MKYSVEYAAYVNFTETYVFKFQTEKICLVVLIKLKALSGLMAGTTQYSPPGGTCLTGNARVGEDLTLLR